MGANLQEDAAIWIADLKPEDLVDEYRRRILGERSRSDFKKVPDSMIERAMWARRRDVAGLVAA